MNYRKCLILLVLSSSTAVNASDVICPATVKAGTQLKISAKITNEDCFNAMTINRTVASLMGNSGSGTFGLQGPFVTPLANNFNTLIAHAKCTVIPNVPGHPEWGTHTNVIPTSQIFANIVVIAKVPVGMGGTLVAANAAVLDTSNKLTMAGLCHISVTK
ncbi:MAG: hypothetical protein WCS87_13810 [Methylococcaceae bacterium]